MSGSGERIARICGSGVDARTLRLQLIDELRTSVGFDAYAWLLTDPETSVGTSPLADVPCLPELPNAIRLKYVTALNRWTALDQPVAVLDGAAPRSLLWRELLSRYQVADVASIVFRDRFGCWGFLDLWRTGRGFSASEVEYLTAIVRPVTTALRRAQAHTFAGRALREPAHSGPVVLVLSPSLDVRAQTPSTEAYLNLLVPPDEDRSPVPASAYNVAAQLLALEAGVDANPPWARVHLSGGLWLTLRAARLGDGPMDQRDIAVSIERAAPSERAAVFARAFGLSVRERELLDHLVVGGDTRSVARQMTLSEHTVQDHLKSIFAKAGVHDRRTLLARALGG